MSQTIRIATRKSLLALWQAEFVKNKLMEHFPEINCELVPIVTSGDIFLEKSLAKIGGKGLFIKELEKALLENKADIAVHSMKDVPASFPPQLELAAICAREDASDAFISQKYESLQALPSNAILGTSSLRRQSQAKAIKPELQIKTLRGNIHTRLRKLPDFDAIILATAGLKRMQLEHHISSCFDITQFIPAVGQGALGIECRKSDHHIKDLVSALICPETTRCINAERAFNHLLNGSCQVPIAAHCIENENYLYLNALVASPDGKTVLRTHQKGKITDPIQIGQRAGENLLQQGAKKIIDNLGL